MSKDPLAELVDQVLIDGLPPTLPAALRNAVARGADRPTLLTIARGAGARPGSVTWLAVEAAIDAALAKRSTPTPEPLP
jgi:hypothetical protein